MSALRDPVFSRTQALAAGFTSDQIRWALKTSRWFALRRGLYADSAAFNQLCPTDQHLLQAFAAMSHLTCPSMISHRSAAFLYGLPAYRNPQRVCLTVSRDQRRTMADVDLYTTRDFGRDNSLLNHRFTMAIAITTLARTVVDVARTSDLPETLVVADAALHTSRVTKAELNNVLDGLWRWPHVDRARRALEHADPRCSDPQISWVRGLFIENQLPIPDFHVAIHERNKLIGRFDFAWPELGVLAHVDRLNGTPSDQLRALRQQRVIDEYARQLGFTVLALNPDELAAHAHHRLGPLRKALAQQAAA